MGYVAAMRSLSPFLLGLALTFTAAPAFADIFLKIADVDGESTDDKHKSWLMATSLTSRDVGAGVATQATGAGGAAAAAVPARRVTFHPFSITRKIDKSSARLAELPSKHAVLSEMTIELSRDGQREVVWRIVLKEVAVTSYRPLPHPAGTPATSEEILVTPKTVELWSRPVLANGAVGEWVKRTDAAKRELPSVFGSATAAPPAAARP
jgi:type VI protein secretion system component Hcp